MATVTSSLNNICSSDGSFQAWITGIDSAITTLGWVNTADTGQCNPATVTRTGVSTYAGYRIYKMNDALQATVPCFLRIDFGQGASANNHAIKFQIGTSTNGAGTLTGNVSTAFAYLSTATTTANCYFSGSTSRLQIALWPNATTYASYWSIERDKDATGADTSYGVHIINAGTAQYNQQFIPPTTLGPVAVVETKVVTLLSSQASQSNGTDVGVGVIRPVYGALRNPGIGYLTTSRADWTTEVSNTVTIYATARNYLAFNYATIIATTAVGNNTSPGLMMLFE